MLLWKCRANDLYIGPFGRCWLRCESLRPAVTHLTVNDLSNVICRLRLFVASTVLKKEKADIALHVNPISELYGTSLVVWDHTVLPATRHKWTRPAYTPAMQPGTRFTCSGGMEGWVDLVDLIAPRPGVEPATFRSRVRRRTAAPPRQPSVRDSYVGDLACSCRVYSV